MNIKTFTLSAFLTLNHFIFGQFVPEISATYRLQNLGTNNYLKTDGNDVLTTKTITSNGENRKWKIVESASGLYNIDNLSSTVGSIVNNNGVLNTGVNEAPVNQSSQQFEIEQVDVDVVRFKLASGTSQYLSANSSGQVVLSTETNSFSLWRIHRIEQGTKFEPWDKTKWADHYNGDSIVKLWDITEDTYLGFRSNPWEPKISVATGNQGTALGLFNVRAVGIVFDGNNVVIDAREPEDKMPLEDVYQNYVENPKITGVYVHYAEKVPGLDSTVIKNFNIKGFRVGVDDKSRHPGIVKNNDVSRNDWGLYCSAWEHSFRNNISVENYEGGIYTGSKSRDNILYKNTFRDNHTRQRQPSFGNVVGDALLRTKFIQNTFVTPKVLTNPQGESYYHQAITIYRNAGEKNNGKHNLREEAPHDILVKGNKIDGYSTGVHFASRMARNNIHDMTREGRDYIFYSTIEDNTIKNTEIGIKVNSEANTIQGNDFENVAKEIVLHCVFDELKYITINNQANDNVYFWYENSEWAEYEDWYWFQKRSNFGFFKADKVIEVSSTVGVPNFQDAPNEHFILNPAPRVGLDKFEDHRYGLPIDTAHGEFFEYFGGHEVVSIYSDPISNVRGTDYYTIVVTDTNGIEINRAGRSSVKWGQLEAGPFIRGPQFESEIAVIPAEPVDGKYPIYLFRRGDAEPRAILCEDNTNPDIKISKASDGTLAVENCEECEASQFFNCVVTSVEHDVIEEKVNVFPNPSLDGVFKLSKQALWTVFSTQGQQLKSGNSNVVDLSGEQKGIYFLKVGSYTMKLMME